MASDLAFFTSTDIKRYKRLLQGLTDVFDEEHWSTILCWCGLIENDEKDFGKYWDLWIIDYREKIVGICGLYSAKHHDNSELWLGWFGMLPQYRGMGFGTQALKFMEVEGRRLGAKKILTYTGDERAVAFYVRSGFVLINVVKDYLKSHPELEPYLGEPMDYILAKNVDL